MINKWTLWKILIFLVLANEVFSKRKHEVKKSKYDSAANTGEAVTFFVMGTGTTDDSQENGSSENNFDVSGSSGGNPKSKTNAERTIYGHGKFPLRPTKKHKVPNRKRHTNKHKTKTENASSRESIANQISSMDDVQESYKHGVDLDDENMERVKMIDDGALSDYFHALNGEEDKQVSSHPTSHLPMMSKNEEDSNESKLKPKHTNVQSQSQTSSDNASLGYEIYSDNPDEEDDFYAAIEKGKKPSDADMKKTRPTKSHFGQGGSKHTDETNQRDQKENYQEDEAQLSKAPNHNAYVQEETQNAPVKNLEREVNEENPNDHTSGPNDASNEENGGMEGNGRLNSEEQAGVENHNLEGQRNDYSSDIHAKPSHNENSNYKKANDESNSGNINKDVTAENNINGLNDENNSNQELDQPMMNSAHPGSSINVQAAAMTNGQEDGEQQGEYPNEAVVTQEYNSNQPGMANHENSGNNSKGLAPMSSPFLSNPFLNPFNLFGSDRKQKPNSKEHKNTEYYKSKAESKEPPVPSNFKGTRILGGKITGGKISGGIIQGGKIIAGDVEGGVIKGGQIEGGKFLNGTMEGGILHNGLIEGGHFINGTFDGGIMKGGSIYGGKIKGGSIEGGVIEGGLLLGGTFRGGSLQGGVIKGGDVEGGSIKGGNMEGGIITGGSIEGGSLKEGKLSGGSLRAGVMLGGKMTNGSIEGGTLRGGSISGGILKGGTMYGGELKGGVVLAGKIKGGIIEGGVIEGGEIGEGVIVKSGRINGTVVSVSATEQERKEKDSQGKPNVGAIIHSPKKVELTENKDNNLNQYQSQSKDGEKAKMDLVAPQGYEQQAGLTWHNDDLVEPAASESRSFSSTHNGKHHVVFDGVSFDIPEDGFSNLIRRMNGDPKEIGKLIKTFDDGINDTEHVQQQTVSKTNVSGIEKNNKTYKAPIKQQEDSGIKPEDIITKLSPTRPRSIVSHIQVIHTGQNDKMTLTDAKLRPSYHWSLSKLIGDRIPGSPGAAMITHGHIKPTRGGLAFNGYDAWLAAGDFAGGCISAPDRCDDGFAFEMTLKMDKDTLKNNNDMRYIVDSGASTFNSKGFSLYTLHGKLRADIAIPNDSLCLETPLETDRWQDVLVTWKKDQGLRLYINCELKGETKGNEHCLGCRSPGCHVTDYNTKLMIGRPNYSPHFHCTKFESGDISFWEKYLSPDDVNTICGRDTVPTKPSSSSENIPQDAHEPVSLDEPAIENGSTAPQQTANENSPLAQEQPSSETVSTESQHQESVPVAPVQQATQSAYVVPQQPFSQPQASAPFVGQQLVQPQTRDPTQFTSMLQPGKLYEYTQYIPSMSPPPLYNMNQQAQAYPAAAPAPMMPSALYSSPLPYATGGKRELSRLVSVDYAKMYEEALRQADGNLLVARQNIRNASKNAKRRNILRHLHSRHKN